MPTRFVKQSEHLEHAIDRVLVMISERRRVRSLHGINEQPPHNILTAALELINMVKMILSILERPPFDCMSEFSSLKNHLIKHITLLKHFSEQPDLSHEMESDMIDVCKGVTKICHYIIALPPYLPESETHIPEFITPEKRPHRMQVPITIEPEVTSSSMEPGPDSVPPNQHLSMTITTTSSSNEPIFPLQAVSLPNERVPDRFEYSYPERLNTPSNEGAVMMRHDEGNKSETEVSDKKVSETVAGYFNYKSLQFLRIIENDSPLMDSGSERCMIDSDSDRGIGLDSDLEERSKDSDSVIWGMNSDSEKCPRDSDSTKHLLEAENYQMATGSVEDLMVVERCQVDSDSLKYWMDSGSEKCLVDSDSEKCLMDSDNERLEIDSDSERCPMVSASMKYLLKAEKYQMASESVKRLMESEKSFMETEKLWMVSATERYIMDSDAERGVMDSASASGAHLMVGEKHQEKIKSERYMIDSDSEPCGMDSDSERCGLTSTAVKCLMDGKTFQLSTDTEGLWIDSWSERRKVDLDSDSVKHMMKAEYCQKTSDLQKFWTGLRSESERSWVVSEREQLDFDHNRCWDSSQKYQHRSARLQNRSGKYQDDLQKHWDNFERHQVDTNSKKHQTNSGNERHQNEFESERHLMRTERGQCLIQLENERLQKDEGKKRHLMESDVEKEHRIAFDSERHNLDSENEALRLGARRKDNRPQGFWRPVFLPLPLAQEKKTKEQHSVQQIENKAVSTIQLMRYLNDDKIMRFKELSPTLSDKQESWQKLEKCSHNLSLDPNTLMYNKSNRNANHKISVYKSHCKDYIYTQSFQSPRCQMDPIHLLSAEDYTSDISAPDYDPTSTSPVSVVHSKIHRNSPNSLEMGAQICSKYLMEINNSPFHKCLMNSDDDSDPDCPLHFQILLDSKYSLSPKSVRHHKISQNSPLSQSLGPKHPVGIRCPLHQEVSKYSLDSTSYLHCENCSALQTLIGSTITCTFPMNPQNTMGCHNIPGLYNVISTSNVANLGSESKFNLPFKPKNEANPKNEAKPVSAGNLKDKANAKDKPLFKDKTDHEDETDSENETDADDETDFEDEDTKDKKDPEDKSDPDDTDPKDSDAENDSDTNNGSDPSDDAGPTDGADSNSAGDPNNGTDPNSESDPNIDNASNNDTNSKYSTGPAEDTHTNNSDTASGLDSGVDQESTTDSNNDTNPNYISGPPNGTGLDYTSGSNNCVGPRNATIPGNDICPNIGPGPQKIRMSPNRLGPSNNGTGPPKYPASKYNVRPNNATTHSNAISPNNDTDSNYDTGPISAAGHNYVAAPNYDTDLDYVPGFTHSVGTSFLVNPKYIARNRYVGRPSFTDNIVNVTDTNTTTTCNGTISPSYTAFTIYASDINRALRFTHFFVYTFVINPNYDVINTHNAHNFTSANNINNFPELELEFHPSLSIPNIVYVNATIFAAGINYTSTPDNLTTSKISDPSKLGGNYTIFDDHKFGADVKNLAHSMASASFKHASGSKNVLNAKESGFFKDFSKVQNPVAFKGPATLNFHANPNILLPSFDIIVEAEPPDVVKFAISSGAVNHFLKMKTTCKVDYFHLKNDQIFQVEAKDMFSRNFHSKIPQNHLLSKDTVNFLKLNFQTGRRQNLGP
nr:uncharacterized protein LOC105885282 [Microcebus murinus]